MTTLFTPGVYRRAIAPLRPAGRLARGDIPVFLGYTRRGPAGLAARVQTMIDFVDIFGEPLESGYLGAAVKGFFETGGRAAYVVRVLEPRARSATSLLLGDGASLDALAGSSPADNPVFLSTGSARPVVWRAEAGFAWPLVDPRRSGGAANLEDAGWIQQIERIYREFGHRTSNPGAWANALSVSIRRTSRAQTRSPGAKHRDGRVLAVQSLTGLEPASVIELTQPGVDGVTRLARTTVRAMDRGREQIEITDAFSALLAEDGTPADLDPLAPLAIASVEFDIQIYLAGKLAETFNGLAPHPRHRAALTGRAGLASRWIGLVPIELDAATGGPVSSSARTPLEALDWTRPAAWPQEGDFFLSGGWDGLESVSARDYERLLRSGEIARLEDVALVAAPDLVLPPLAPTPIDHQAQAAPGCRDLTPPAVGEVFGRVVDILADGRERPLAGVEVDIAGPGGRTRTNANGEFRLSGLPLSLASVRLVLTGYERLEFFVQPETFTPSQAETFVLTPLALPRALSEDEIYQVQRMIAEPALVGGYKIAVLDPPRAEDGFERMRAWRARLGDSMRMTFFGPWLRVPDGKGASRPAPPSGHVCGAFAAAELATGVHRSCANLPLRFCEGLTLEISPEAQAVLNPEGINLIRNFPGRGVRVYGTRTLSSDPEWRTFTARRVVDAIEKSLERGLQWMVFEPNTVMSRHGVEIAVGSLLESLWRGGVLAGDTPEAAFQVKCDLDNNPDDSRAQGRLVAQIGVAPTTPFEFIVFRIGNAFDALKVTEAR